MILAGFATGTVASGPTHARAASDWRAVDAETGRIVDLEGLEQLATDIPDSASVRLRLLTAHIRAGDKARAREALVWLLDRGYAFGPGAQATLAAVFEDFDPDLLARTAQVADPIARSEVVATIPAGARLIEGLSPAGDGQLAAASIVDRALYLSDVDGGWTRKDFEGAGSLSGIAFDESSDILWTSSGVYDPTPAPETAFRGLIGWNRRTDEVHRVALAAEGTPSDLVLAADGRIFASDPLGGQIYAADPDDQTLSTIVPTGTFRSPQGLVPVDGGRKLLVSDYRYGLATVDLRTNEVRRVDTKLPFALDGIDGMWAHGARIVAVQNGFAPARIVLLQLNREATEVIKAEVLESGHPDWLEPLGGTVRDGTFYYIASGQWDRFGEGGVANTELPPLPTEIRRIALPSATD